MFKQQIKDRENTLQFTRYTLANERFQIFREVKFRKKRLKFARVSHAKVSLIKVGRRN